MASFAPDSNDPLAVLMQLIDRVRAGEVRIENFRITVSPSYSYDNYTVSGQLVPMRAEPPSVEFALDVVADPVGTGRASTPCETCDGRGYRRNQNGGGSIVCLDCEGRGIRPTVTQLESFSSMQGVKVRDTRLDNPWEPEFWNVTAQGAYVTKHGMEKAKTAASEAGSYIGATAPSPPFCIVRTYTGSVRLAVLPTSKFVKRISEYISRFSTAECVINMPQRAFDVLVAEGAFSAGADPENMTCCGIPIVIMKSTKKPDVKQLPKPTPPSQPPKQTRELIFDE